MKLSSILLLLCFSGALTAQSSGRWTTLFNGKNLDGKLEEQHGITAKAPTIHGDRWVCAEVLVLGDSLIQHIIGGEVVISYSKPVVCGAVVSKYDPAAKKDGTLLKGGYIALQSESHPIEFKQIKLMILDENGRPIRPKKRL